MTNLTKLGRAIFTAALAFFGVQYLAYANTRMVMPGPPWPSVSSPWAYVVAAVFIASAAAVAHTTKKRNPAILAGLVFLGYALGVYLPPLIRHLHDPRPWTSGFEVLALAGACFVSSGTSSPANRNGRTALFGEYAYAISLVVFGVQHLIYGPFVATLVPAWIPAHLFWAYFVGAAFIASAISIVSQRQRLLAASLLGLMFLLWVFILHLPRVAASPHNGNEWTSAFVALAMSGGAFLIAGRSAGTRGV
jgi:uncharacterized membrane protein